ncbi:MAG: UDP-3-O-acyl-N-acetylglucosamine deacetylase [Deltaproteobacteria bacterium]|nr:UDP-3-O-acyl-N-acetylglucosamine deacetylase [Deltaproteobacteria bacterium]
MQSAQRTVLVVDDEDVIRETVREILTDEGYRVIAPLDGSEVMDLVSKEAPDVILLDVWMPEMDGIVLLRRIRREHPEARVIMISGHGSIHTAVTATKLGAFDFIEKPLSLDGLLATIERACGDARREVSAGEERLHAHGGGVGQPFVQSGFHGNGDSGVPQKTLRKSVVACGLGLHSGVSTGVILHPLPEDSGIHFGGISADATVPAHLDYVRSTDFATSLQRDGVVVGTVEHLLAALHSYGITNLLIKMYGEIPIMDGSAIEFCRLIEEAGVEEQQGKRPEIVIDRTLRVGGDGEDEIIIEPADGFTVRYRLQYPSPVGTQEFTYVYKGADSFRDQIAPARTFGFLRDFERLERLGLIKGGRLGNCILIDDEKVINTVLRFEDEFVRHKILDIVGDFSLIGRPVRGRVTAKMTGHADNIALLRQVAETYCGLGAKDSYPGPSPSPLA